jgi:(2Fe-2S) ferredoxin
MATWDLSKTKHHLLICNGGSCNQYGAEELTLAIRGEIYSRGLDEIIHTTRTRCNGRCEDKCVVVCYPEGIWYRDLKPEDASPLINSLSNQYDLTNKISHSFSGGVFKREQGIIPGVSKELKR